MCHRQLVVPTAATPLARVPYEVEHSVATERMPFRAAR